SFASYANSQATALANNGMPATADISTQVSVDGANSGVWLDAAGTAIASGRPTRRAQVSAQLSGVSTSRADILCASAAAGAFGASPVGAQVKVDGGGRGQFSTVLRGEPVSDISGQAESRVDIAIASSALPILDPARVLAARALPRIYP